MEYNSTIKEQERTSQDTFHVPNLTAEQMARLARQQFRDRLPSGVLNKEAYKIYERLYGTPLAEETPLDNTPEEEDGPDALLRESADGTFEEVPYSTSDGLDADAQLQRDMEQSLDPAYDPSDPLSFTADEDGDADPDEPFSRSHPYTIAARFCTSPTTLPLPPHALVNPVNAMLSHLSNKHLDDTAQRVFGGPGLPYATGSPVSSRIMPQKPIPLAAAQTKMQAMEADVFMAAILPGAYAAVTSVLVEARKRLGKVWLDRLHARRGGPRILDAGTAGAAVLAWREVLKASWQGDGPAPLGRATVITGAPTLRERAALVLENTTFLPRLPDADPYAATADAFDEAADPGVYDIVAAPYALWALGEERERHALIHALWRLTDPRGGLLLLLEKGIPRGFEVIADARAHILGNLMSPRTRPADAADPPDDPLPARIVAPCTTHSACPLYRIPGVSRGRKDHCHFTQRYTRPPFYQRLLGARDRNHEDVRFSYLAVQRGGEASAMAAAEGWAAATEAQLAARAGQGYGDADGEILPPAPDTTTNTHISASADSDAPPNPLTLPRTLLPPLKRRGHVVLDVCTPAGAVERWTIPKSWGRQAYRDARKARWGDLWALGAKTRVPRNVRLGRAGEEGADEAEGRARAPEGMGARKRDGARGRAKARARRREETRALLGAGE